METSLQEQLQGIYEEQRLDEQREREAASVDPADYLMNDWPEPPERTRLLAELLESAGVAVRGPVDLGDVQEIEVFGVQTDSRRVEVQDVFVCLEGEGLDGHDFALDAYRRGACAVIASRPLPEVPGECPVLLVDDTLAALHRIANAFYDWPSRAMTTVGEQQGPLRPTSALLPSLPSQLLIHSLRPTSTLLPSLPSRLIHSLRPNPLRSPPFPSSPLPDPLKPPTARVAGVTGTNGKTTTSWLIRSVLEQMALVVGMVGTIEYALAEDRLDEEGSLWIPSEPDPTLNRKSSSPYRVAPYRGKYAVPNTTPGPLPMVKLLAGMRDRGAQAAVLEASSHGLSQGRLGGTDVDVAVFTGLSQDHLDFHGTMEEYKQAKLLLFRGLGEPAGALRERLGQLEERLEALEKGEGGGSEAERERERVEAAIAATEEQLADYLGRKRCVVNLDDPYVDEFRAAAGEVPVVTFGINGEQVEPGASVGCGGTAVGYDHRAHERAGER